MAEQAERRSAPPSRRDPAPQHSAQHDAMLERRAAAEPAADYGAMLSARPPGPQPIQRAPNRTGLPDRLKAGVEALSGLAMDDVKVHYNSSRPAQLQAHAFTQGTDIHVGPGQTRHLAHEAWHVVQQKQGRVSATAQLKGVAVNNDAGLEREADRMAEILDRPHPVHAAPANRPSPGGGAPIQGKFKDLTDAQAKKLATRVRLTNENAAEAIEAELLDAGRVDFSTWLKTNVRNIKLRGQIETYRQTIVTAEAARTEARSKKRLEEQNAARQIQPDSLIQLHQEFPEQVANYRDWLFHDETWLGRPQKVLDNLTNAKKLVVEAEGALLLAQQEFPKLVDFNRTEAVAHERDHAATIRQRIDVIRVKLEQIDELVQEPPVAAKAWQNFMGDLNTYEYADGAAENIPVIFYKKVTDYKAIVVPANQEGVTRGTYNFPNGPKVRGRKGSYDLKVNAANIFGKDTVLTNSKDSNDRTTQIDINVALIKAGVSMAGKDGDHVRDLGFGGKDRADNYWPLQASINRRPFLGWRGSYGINYLSNGNPHTAPITALAGKKLIIRDFMGPTEGNVPAIGVTPDPISGAVRTKPSAAKKKATGGGKK